MKFVRPLWVAFRTAVLATAVFWVTLFIVDHAGWQAPLGATEPLIFLVVVFLAVLMTPRN